MMYLIKHKHKIGLIAMAFLKGDGGVVATLIIKGKSASNKKRQKT